uniref:GAT domain-containing protein n=1 Tax=Ascaris lumbricoides TaxID=6252 RepID=A0A0M3IN42_ASCLU
MRENLNRQRRRSVKFVDAPPEVVRFSNSQPSWIIPLTSSASTPALNTLKRSGLDDQESIGLISRSHAVTLRRKGSATRPKSDERPSWSRRVTIARCPQRLSLTDDRLQNSQPDEVFELSPKSLGEDSLQLADCWRAMSQSCHSLQHLHIQSEEQQRGSALEGNAGCEYDAGMIQSKVHRATRMPGRFKNADNLNDLGGCFLPVLQESLETREPAQLINAVNDGDMLSENIDLEMARHVAECLKQWNTALDMVLQARQLLESAQNLPADDREMMLRILDRGIRTGRKRLDVVDDRYEPDGGRSDSPNSVATHASHGSAHPQQMTPTAITGDVDPTLFFQQHGHQLLALLQQNMAKQN